MTSSKIRSLSFLAVALMLISQCDSKPQRDPRIPTACNPLTSYCIPRRTNWRTCCGSEAKDEAEDEESACRFMMMLFLCSPYLVPREA
uniref:Hypothetical secreted peptide n=1 Tax=Rhipicephalus sanguineus TaxID=34632 RepID=C9W1R0_RHISA